MEEKENKLPLPEGMGFHTTIIMNKIKDLVIGDHLYYSYLKRDTLVDDDIIPLVELAIGDFEITDISIVTKEKHYYYDDPYNIEEYWLDCFYKIFTVVPVDEMARNILKKLYDENCGRSFPSKDITDYSLTMKIDCNSDSDYTAGRGTNFPFYTTRIRAFEQMYSYVNKQKELVEKYQRNLDKNKEQLKNIEI